MSSDASHPSPKDCRDAFHPSAARYRRFDSIYVGLRVVATVSILLALVVPHPLKSWMIGVVILCLVLTPLGWLLTPSLRCPACMGDTAQRSFGRHCPECGGCLRHRGSLQGPECSSCGKGYWSARKGRGYLIHYCTHCGAGLDDQGV